MEGRKEVASFQGLKPHLTNPIRGGKGGGYRRRRRLKSENTKFQMQILPSRGVYSITKLDV